MSHKLRRLLLLSALIVVNFASAQPVRWNFSIEKVSGHQFTISAVATIEPGWHLYAQQDTASGIEPVQLLFDGEKIRALGALQADIPAETINDQIFDNRHMNVYRRRVQFSQDLAISGNLLQLHLTVSGFAANGNQFEPFEQSLFVPLSKGTGSLLKEELELTTLHIAAPASDCGKRQEASGSGLVTLFLLGFGGGLIALLTPCVFPMVPLTVSYFSGKAGSRSGAVARSLVYGFFITAIYLVASLPFHFTKRINPEIFNTISTSAGLNVFFFVLFTLFALSFFGLFEIRLPAFFSNRSGNKSSVSSVAGIFFMALTLVIVSFSCTGPILGSLLVGSISANGGPWQLTAGLGGFGLALALPFALFALFPQWLKVLPKSGGWLEVFKKSLAFVELALALKFLSNADLVQHWGLLKREVFIGLWILVAGGLAFYLLDIGTFLREGRKGMSPLRTAAGIVVMGFTLYLLPGLSPYAAANLKVVSGFPPPLSYSLYSGKLHSDKELKPTIVNDYAQALALARSAKKPILIDFTGWACVNCRKMEEQVWTHEGVKALIQEKFILLSLYVDDRKKLPADQQFRYTDGKGNEKNIITVGDKWATFQSVNFKQVTQPLYAVLSPEGELMNQPVGYMPDATQYQSWLECGIDAFHNRKDISFINDIHANDLPHHTK